MRPETAGCPELQAFLQGCKKGKLLYGQNNY
jgi:hypothetical protein